MGVNITVAAGPQFEDGTYVGTLASIEEKVIQPKMGAQAGQDVTIREWLFDLTDLTTGEVITDLDTDEPIIGRATSSVATGPRSKQVAILVALLGPSAAEPGNQFTEDDLIGKKALVTIAHDKGGYPNVESLQAMPRQRTVRQQAAPAAAPAPAPEAEGAEDDDLPF